MTPDQVSNLCPSAAKMTLIPKHHSGNSQSPFLDKRIFFLTRLPPAFYTGFFFGWSKRNPQKCGFINPADHFPQGCLPSLPPWKSASFCQWKMLPALSANWKCCSHQGTSHYAAPTVSPEGTKDGGNRFTGCQALSHCSYSQWCTRRGLRVRKNWSWIAKVISKHLSTIIWKA